MSHIKIVSLNIGLPKKIKLSNGKELMTGIKKEPTQKKVYLNKRGFELDDSYADCHGGFNMAVHVFAFENYAYYNLKAGYQIPLPTFGENLTLSGYTEEMARVGDILKIGDARVQVSQPTERCKNIGLSIGLPQMLKWIQEELRTGFYFRVLEEGSVSVESSIQLEEQGHEDASIAHLNQAMFRHIKNSEWVTAAANTPHISEEWQMRIKHLHQKALGTNDA